MQQPIGAENQKWKRKNLQKQGFLPFLRFPFPWTVSYAYAKIMYLKDKSPHIFNSLYTN